MVNARSKSGTPSSTRKQSYVLDEIGAKQSDDSQPRNAAGLLIETKCARVVHCGQDLKLTRHWVYVYGLLALRKLEGGTDSVDVREINCLPTWTELQARSVATSLFRHVERMHARGLQLITSPPNERTKRFVFDASATGKIKVDVNLKHLRAWLGLNEFIQKDVYQGSTAAMRWIALAEIAFEQGRYAEIESLIEKAGQSEPSKDQWMQALAVVAWSKTYAIEYDKAREVIKQMHEFVRQSRNQEKRNPSLSDRLSPSLEALVWLQEARLNWPKWNPNKKRRALSRAAALLRDNDHREWGGIEANLGYIAQVAGNLEEAEKRVSAALVRFSKAHWGWGIHTQQNNLAALNFLHYEQLAERDPVKAMAHLEQAISWTKDSMEFAEQLDFGGAVDLEVNLAFAYRVKGDLEAADYWVRRAFNIAKASKSQYNIGLAFAEQAELEFAQGDSEVALQSWREAITLLESAAVPERWITSVKQRILELENHQDFRLKGHVGRNARTRGSANSNIKYSLHNSCFASYTVLNNPLA